MHRSGWFVIAAVAGCSHSSAGGGGGADAARGDAELAPDAGAAQRVHARVGALVIAADGELQEAVDPTQLTVTLADGTHPTLSDQPDGSVDFTRASAAQGYTIAHGATEVIGTTAALNFLPPVFGHTLLAPVTQATALDVSLTPTTPAGATTIVVTGQRAVLAAPAATPFAFDVDWRDARGVTGDAPGLIDAAEGDTVVLVHTVTDGDGHTQVDGTAARAITQTNGQPTTIATALTPTPLSGCVTIQAPAAAEVARLSAAVVGSGAAGARVAVLSQPGTGAVTPGGLPIATTVVTADGATDVAYAEPFAGEDLLAGLVVTRAVTHAAGAVMMSQEATLMEEQVLTGSAHACGPALAVTVVAGPAFPAGVSVGGAVLTGDNQAIAVVGDAAVPVVITQAAVVGDRYQVELDDVTGGAVARVGVWVAAEPTIALERSAFASGRVYQVRVGIATGYAGVASGDFTTPTYPAGMTVVPSFTFTIGG